MLGSIPSVAERVPGRSKPQAPKANAPKHSSPKTLRASGTDQYANYLCFNTVQRRKQAGASGAQAKGGAHPSSGHCTYGS